MSPRDFADPAFQRIWIEMVNREGHLRLRNFEHSREKYEKLATLRRETLQLEDALMERFKWGLRCTSITVPRIAKQHEAKNEALAKGLPLDSIAPKERVIPPVAGLPRMKPVDEDILKLLDEPGGNYCSRNYLSRRYKQGPFDKFNHIDVESWRFGWPADIVNDKIINFGSRKYQKSCVKSFYRSRGVHADPEHHQQPIITKRICMNF